MSPLQVALSLAGIIIVIFGAYYATYYIGVKASGQNRNRIRNRGINLLERFAITKDKSFCLIEIAGKVYVLGITNQNITLIDTLDAEEYAKAAEKQNYDAGSASPLAQPEGGFINRFVYYMVEGFRNRGGKGGNSGAGGGAFADSMRSAREASEQNDPKDEDN